MKNYKALLPAFLTASLLLPAIPAPAEPAARALLDKACAADAAAPWLSRVDTTVQSTVATVGSQKMQQPTQTNVVRIDIDRTRLLARQTAVIEGKELVILRLREKTAMKLGDGPWESPKGPYEQIGRDLGNLFVCEQETPESAENAPDWVLTGSERLDGTEARVIATRGNSAARLAQERMKKGMAKNLTAASTQPPAVKVIQYAVKHWIGEADNRTLKAVQTSKYEMQMALPNGRSALLETSSTATSQYQFDRPGIQIPAEAEAILSAR